MAFSAISGAIALRIAWISLGQEVFALCVFGKLAAHDLIQMDDAHRDFGPAKASTGFQAPLPGNERAGKCHHDRMEEPDLFDALLKGSDIAKVAAVTLAHIDRVNRPTIWRGTAIEERGDWWQSV